MVARQRPDGHLDPWKDAAEPTIMDLSLGRPGAPRTKETLCRCQRNTSHPQPPRPTVSSLAPSSSATTDPTRHGLRCSGDRQSSGRGQDRARARDRASLQLVGHAVLRERRRAEPRRGRARPRRDAADRRAGRDADRVLGARGPAGGGPHPSGGGARGRRDRRGLPRARARSAARSAASPRSCSARPPARSSSSAATPPPSAAPPPSRASGPRGARSPPPGLLS